MKLRFAVLSFLFACVVAWSCTGECLAAEGTASFPNPDTTQSDSELQSEEQYFIVDAILDEGLAPEEIADSIGPHVKGLTLEHREMLYKEHKRFTLHKVKSLGSLQALLVIPLIASIGQGDGTGILLGIGGLGCLYAASSSGSNSSVSEASGYFFLGGLGMLIVGGVRALVIDNRNAEHNTQLSSVLHFPMDVSCTVNPTLRSFPDGTIYPTLSLNIQF